jgi:hypothetical protein
VKRGRRILLILAVCVVALVVAALVWPRGEREPVYQGKTLSEWLRNYRQPVGAMKPVISSEAAYAVRHIGTNGLPFLVKWIQADQNIPKWKELLFVAAYRSNLKSRARGEVLELVAGSQLRAGRAFEGFEILGEIASPAIPDLVQIAKAGKQGSAELAISALAYLGKDALPPLLALATNKVPGADPLPAIGKMGYLGTNAHPAVLFLIQRLEDPEKAAGAADILGRLGVESDRSVPALTRCLQSTNQDVRLFGVKGLGKFGEQARPALPEVLKVLNDSAEDVRITATNAVRLIAPELLRTNETGAVSVNASGSP